MKQIRILGLIVLLVPAFSLEARRAPSHLSDAAQVAAFYRLTGKIRCYCGCNGLSGDCGHVEESCFGVQMRRFVENRLLEGKGEEEILEGIVHGFGAGILADPQLRELERLGRRDLVTGFQNGFGPSILYREPSSPLPVVTLAVGMLLALGGFWLRRRVGNSQAASPPPRAAAAKLLEKTRDLDR